MKTMMERFDRLIAKVIDSPYWNNIADMQAQQYLKSYGFPQIKVLKEDHNEGEITGELATNEPTIIRDAELIAIERTAVEDVDMVPKEPLLV